ncbi:ABC transporter permease [Phytohabitans houttuyneae]|uniref:ABC transporter permease n=1 Tax=Phytohabitans houttuyneae TaxID=1076126 RepID=A0A6V8JVK5_9ACTN|nr:ABC transporter permease [Phytohabitans houttuyneae]GFJ76642.1 ABC transporter permease [Phytohabitans houttuyneae]
MSERAGTAASLAAEPSAVPEPAPPRSLPRRRPARGGGLWAIRTPPSRPARWTLTVVSVAVPVVGWQVLSMVIDGRPDYLPGPVDAVAAGIEMARSGQLATDAWATVARVLQGFGLAVLVSVPLGILMGSFPAGQALLEPLVGLLRYLPASAFIPLLIIWLGLGEPSKVALLFLAAFFFNTLMTADAVRQVPLGLIDVSYTLGARRGEVLRKVIVPYALPGMIDSVRVNAAASWSFVVVAELIASESGLGYRIVRAQRFNQIDRIFAVLVVIALIGLTIDLLLRLTRDRVGRWV